MAKHAISSIFSQFEIERCVCVMAESQADADRASIGHNTSELECFLQQHDGSFPGLANARHHTLSGRVGPRQLQFPKFSSESCQLCDHDTHAELFTRLHQALPRALRGWMTHS
jgi:hypothetical protein